MRTKKGWPFAERALLLVARTCEKLLLICWMRKRDFTAFQSVALRNCEVTFASSCGG